MLGPPSEFPAGLGLEFPASVVLHSHCNTSFLRSLGCTQLAEPARVALATETSSCIQNQSDQSLAWSWDAQARRSYWV